MKTVFEAANSLEAHMIVGLLAQSGIEGQILGEALQGGMGDLPAAGLVRVVVNDTDFVQARILVEDWNSTTVENLAIAEPIRHKSSSASHIIVFAIGLVIGTAATGSYFLARPSSQGIDYDRDGRLDEFWYYNGNRIQRVESDFNKDGKIDAITDYDAYGVAQKSRTDMNFDGKFEVQSAFEKGVIVSANYDLNQDGHIELTDKFRHGMLRQRDFFATSSTFVKKRQHFEGATAVRAEVDTDDDGIFDTLLKYDDLEDIIGTEPLRKTRND